MTPNGGSIKVEVIAIDEDIKQFSQVPKDKQIETLSVNTIIEESKPKWQNSKKGPIKELIKLVDFE